MKTFTDFTFHMQTEIIFGKGTEMSAGALVKKYGGTKVMLVFGSGSIYRTKLYDKVVESLCREAIPFVGLGGVKANPLRSLVEEGLELAQKEKVDFLLAVGGGSVIDTAKAIALGLANNGEYWKFYCGEPAEKIAPVGTINTISAAGSETSGSSVLVDDVDTKEKRGFMWSVCKPVFAIMNPELTYTVSSYQTGAGAADIFAHTVNRYFCAAASKLGDEFSEGLLRTVVKYGPVAVMEPECYEARAELMLAASFSHNDVTGIGRSGPGGSEHWLEQQISAIYNTAHVAGLAVIMPAWLQYIVDHGAIEQIRRIAGFGVKVFGVDEDFADEKATANDGLDRFRQWLRSIGMPLTLKELGVPKTDLQSIIERCVSSFPDQIVPGYMPLNREAVTAIFTSVAE